MPKKTVQEYPRLSSKLRIRPFLKDLEKKYGECCVESIEKVQLDRVQEMDRSSMRWLVNNQVRREQRAGSDQRIWQSLETKTLMRSKTVCCVA